MFDLLIKRRAITMVKEAFDWYEEQQDGLGYEFLIEVENCYSAILKNPERYGFIENGFRRNELKRFPYVVIYEIIEAKIIVFAVFHTKKHPDKRLKD